MKNLVAAIFLMITLASCTTTQLSKVSGIEKRRLLQEIEDIIKGIDPNVNLGINITSLASNQVVFEKNAKRHFIPSSTIKLFTLAAALHYLGPSFRFTTAILSDGLIDASGSVKNIYIKGSGDPSLMDSDVIALAYELKQMGIKDIGNIYVDDTVFDDVLWGKGTMWDDRHQGFSAPVAGLNLNYNRLLIKTLPSRSILAHAHTLVRPLTTFVEIQQKALTKNDRGSKQLTVQIERGKGREEEWPALPNDGLHLGDKIVINGQTHKTAEPHYHKLAINDPGMLVGTLFKDHLNYIGIKVKGKVARRATPVDAISLTTHQSRSLTEAAIDFTKISNNIANDALIKAIAAQAGAKPATLNAGLKLVQDFLVKEVGIAANTLITADGAGLSRYNLVTPEQMVQLLSYAAHHFSMGPEFMASLPIGGEDGALMRRFTADHMRGHVRAKTGTMTGCSAIAGYLTAVDGNRYAFTIMINGFIGNTAKYANMQDQILATMLTDTKAKLANVK